jgi:hypothetical protein
MRSLVLASALLLATSSAYDLASTHAARDRLRSRNLVDFGQPRDCSGSGSVSREQFRVFDAPWRRRREPGRMTR